MSKVAPPLDPRTAAQLRQEVGELLHENVGWVEVHAESGERDQASAALIGIFARFCEIAIQRLNQVPEKNFLAFLDLLGVSRQPPQPARVPLTFTLAAGSATDTVVPAGTQVAAPPAEGEKDPVIFETQRELTVVAARLVSLIGVDAERDELADHGSLFGPTPPTQVRAYAGDRANEHVLYIGHREVLAYPEVKTLTLTLVLAGAQGETELDTRNVRWERWDGMRWQILLPNDGTNQLRTSGSLTFNGVSAVPLQAIDGVTSRWLRAVLTTPITPGELPANGMIRAAHLPLLRTIRLVATLERNELAAEHAFTNGIALDTSKPFQPFGDKPKLGDAFYLGQPEVFSQPGAVVTLEVTLAPPLPNTAADQLQLRWEAWNGKQWKGFGTTSKGLPGGGVSADTTKAFTLSGTVTLTLPADIKESSVNGVTSTWLRVVLAAGDYGLDAVYLSNSQQPSGVTLRPASFAAPVVGALVINYLQTTRTVVPDALRAWNNLAFEDLQPALSRNEAVLPFRGCAAQPTALYAAFALPPARPSFPNRTVSLYHGLHVPGYGEQTVPLHPDVSRVLAGGSAEVVHRFTLTNSGREPVRYLARIFGGAWESAVAPGGAILAGGASIELTVTVTVPAGALLEDYDRAFLRVLPQGTNTVHTATFETAVGTLPARQRSLRWEYWNGVQWSALTSIDGTERLTRPGVVEFLGPADLARTALFGSNAYWVRALLEPGEAPIAPRLQVLLPNTTIAAQTVTTRNEPLGSSDAAENQRVRTARSPILAGQWLEVREPEPPNGEELRALELAHGARGVVSSAGRSREVWVRWSEVPDFHGSGPHDRHYVLDRFTGQIRFGDGSRGRIPPRGVGNIRMARYQTGGGSAGNRAANSIVQLKTTVPFIAKVYNPQAAAGGFAAESTQALIARAPRLLRHGLRSVALEDYEDLARLASPEVARAKCVPLRRLQDDPLGATRVNGAVSVVVVPATRAAKPLPSLELLTLTENFLRRHAPVTAAIAVVGPLYLRVDVTLEVALASLEGASRIEQAIREQLDAFLHPLSGGRDGSGWDFGREPQRSDLYAIVGGVSGVDHVRQLSIVQQEDLAGARATRRFLVYSGQHQIKLTFVGAA